VDVSSERSGVLRRWLTHWLTCVSVTFLFVMLLQFMEGSSLLQSLDRLGADAVMRLYAPEAASPPVIVVEVGKEPKAEDVALGLRKLKGAGVLALGLDLIAAEDLSGQALAKLVDAVTELSIENIPIAMPLVNPSLAEQVEGLRKVRRASVELSKDIDGIIRSTRQHNCGEIGGRRARLPTLAWAMVDPNSEETGRGCVEPDRDLPILSVPILSVPNSAARTGILLMTMDMIDSNKGLLKGAYVILGAVSAGTMLDRFQTPLGELPGAVIHAEAVWTLAVLAHSPGNSLGADDATRHLAAIGLDLLTGIAAGLVFATYLTCTSRDKPIHGVRIAIRRFLSGIVGLLLMSAILFLLGVGWTWVASHFLTLGLVVGAVVAVFGAMLETLSHLSADLIEPIHWAVGRAVRRLRLPALMLLLCCSSKYAFAGECAYTLSYMGHLPDTVFSHAARWLPFERLEILVPSVTVTMVPAPGSDGDKLSFTSPGSWVLPPCPPRPGFAAAWRSFWQALNARESTPTTGATMLLRGAIDPTSVGPLRPLSTLTQAAGPMIGRPGLALLWAGGRPPFAVELQDEATETRMGRATTDRRLLWLPVLQVSERVIKVNVRDGDGQELRTTLRPVPTLPAMPSGVDGAIELFQGRPAYRMEALRELCELSDTGDALADRAIELIRATGARQ
jgi:hypothetical protein